MSRAQQDDVRKAVEILRGGGLVAFATETVYGLGADATNADAVAKIFAIKGRPPSNPLIVHVSSNSAAKRYVASWPDSAERLARAFWPGPLTFVLPKGPQIVPAVTAGLPTVAVRCPDHPLALQLLREFDGPIAAPSANRSTRVSPTTADHVRRDLGDAVDLILDGGPCRVGIESTVIDLSSPKPSILRLGGIPSARLEEIIGPVDRHGPTPDPTQPTKSPGQQLIHYAPVAPAYRLTEGDLSLPPTFFERGLGIRTIFLIIRGSELAARLRQWAGPEDLLELPFDAEEYARGFYAALREADDRHAQMIWIQDPPPDRQWDAVRDRIHRASRPASEARHS
jgi:L-threonylcarbamoyladenylate synthase